MMLNRSLIWSIAEMNNSFSISEFWSSWPLYPRRIANSRATINWISIRFIPWSRSKKSRTTLKRISLYEMHMDHINNILWCHKIWPILNGPYINVYCLTCDGTLNNQTLCFSDLQVYHVLVSDHNKILFVLMDNSRLGNLFLCI